MLRVVESVRELVERVHQLPYGRPLVPTIAGMLAEQRGTCSLKHLYLAQELGYHHIDCEPQIIHRVYRLLPMDALDHFGPDVAATVPSKGLVDVHRYLKIIVNGHRITIDVTFPGEPWNGVDSMVLACGHGEDHPSLGNPADEKRLLETEHCDPLVREPFIAALANWTPLGTAT